MKRSYLFVKMHTIKGAVRIGASFFAASLILGLVGCSQSKPYVPKLDFSTVSKQQLRQDDLNYLRAAGVQVIQLGETYRLVIASDSFFHPRSANPLSGYRDVLASVVRLLNSYHVITVRVVGYSDCYSRGLPKDALTERQAAVIQEFLSDHGVNARLVYSEGQGARQPVAVNSTSKGRHFNRRVEISFRFIPAPTIYE